MYTGYAGLWVEVDMMITQTVGVTVQLTDKNDSFEAGIAEHTATHCNTLHDTATHCTTLQHTATHRNTLQHTLHTATPVCMSRIHQNRLLSLSATHWNTLQLTATNYNTATHCNTLQHAATRCNTLQHTRPCPGFAKTSFSLSSSFSLQHSATHCNILQHDATYCNTIVHA